MADDELTRAFKWLLLGPPPYFADFIKGVRKDEGNRYRVRWRSAWGDGQGYVRADGRDQAAERARTYHPDHIRIKGVEPS